MNDRNGRISKNLLAISILIVVFAFIAACNLPTGTDLATYSENLASFVQAVEGITPMPADPGAADIYAYAVTVDALATVWRISQQDRNQVVSDRVSDEQLRAQILGVLDGSLTLADLMVADTGMYQDEEQNIVVGLPLQDPIPPDSPIETNGTPEIVDDGERLGMEFDSMEDYLIIPADPSNDLTNHGALEAWLKPDANVNWAGIIHKGTESDWSDEGYSFQYDGSGQLMLALTSAAGQTILVRTNHVLSPAVWSHVVVTWNSSEVYIYVNGIDVVDRITVGFTSTETTITENYPFKSSEGDVIVGTQIPGNSWRFDGVMSGIKIYNRFMEESEVLDNFNE